MTSGLASMCELFWFHVLRHNVLTLESPSVNSLQMSDTCHFVVELVLIISKCFIQLLFVRRLIGLLTYSHLL